MIEKRFDFILEDLNEIESTLQKIGVDTENIMTEGGDFLITLFNNIRIACDLKDDEPDNW